MIGDLTLALRTAKSGLITNQQALNAVANNVSNVNTDGYSRKIVNLQERVLTGTGAGVEIASVTRLVDEQLLQGLRTETAVLSELNAELATLDRLQDLFGRPEDNTSISHTLADFAAAAESLALTPHGTLEQKAVVERGRDLADQLKSMTTSIQDLRRQADVDIAEEVEEINRLIGEIANLNNQTVGSSVVRVSVADLQDQRDQALDALASLMDIRTFGRGDGAIVVFSATGQVLVDSVPATVTHDPAAALSASTIHAAGTINGISVGTGLTTRDLTTEVRGGKLAGLIDLRDRLLPNVQSSLDQLAATLADTVNAAHNRGTAFPGSTSLHGTRSFVDVSATTNHSISLDPAPTGGDTRIVLFDANGNEAAATTLRTIMQAATGLAGGPWTISEVAQTVENWLQGATPATSGALVGFDADGRMTVDLNTTSAFLGLRDTDGSGAWGDLAVHFDSDGDANIDETVSGFSNFFGLNDFFVDDRTGLAWESDVLESSYTLAADVTLRFEDTLGAPQTVTLTAGGDLAAIVETINNEPALRASAVLVPDGPGARLRLISGTGERIAVTDGGGGLLSAIGLHLADVGLAGRLSVRDDIVTAPGRLASAAIQLDTSQGINGRYVISAGDDTAAQGLATALRGSVAFADAGTVRGTTTTLEAHAAAIMTEVSVRAASVQADVDFQDTLVQTLTARSDSVRGVNLDEEMSNLILFEQAYASAARVISTIKDMFDTLQAAVG